MNDATSILVIFQIIAGLLVFVTYHPKRGDDFGIGIKIIIVAINVLLAIFTCSIPLSILHIFAALIWTLALMLQLDRLK